MSLQAKASRYAAVLVLITRIFLQAKASRYAAVLVLITRIFCKCVLICVVRSSRFLAVLFVLARVVFCLCHRVRRWYARTD